MDKIELTNDLWKKLKEWRLQYNVKAKDLADYIEKSPAYISKLESGEIKKIEKSLLEKMVIYISGDSDSYEKFIKKVIYENTDGEAKNKARLLNFDTIERMIPIPVSLVDYIKSKMSEVQINSEDLCNYINENEDLDESDLNISSTTTYNLWITNSATDNNDGTMHNFFILMKTDPNDLDQILSREVTKSNYTFIFAIVYHLLKYENTLKQSNIEKGILSDKTAELLRNYKFYSLMDLNERLSALDSEVEYNNLISDYDKKNYELASHFFSTLNFLSKYDVEYANEKLSNIIENTDMDASFAFAYMAISLKPVQNINTNQKRELLEKINNLIIEFAQTSQNNIELYK